MNVQSRLFDFISSKKISISDFERACGLSNGYVHKIKNSVGKRGLLDIQRKFPELNTDWLLTGEGEMLNDTSSYIVNSDHHGTSVAGNGNNVNTTSALEKALESLMEQQRLTAKAQEQVDRYGNIYINSSNRLLGVWNLADNLVLQGVEYDQ